jgi:formate dehydrogenase iron-sulfur subunit
MNESTTSDPLRQKGILTDVTRCIGCERCVEACVRINKLPRDFMAYFTAKDGLSGNRFTSIVKAKDGQSGQLRMVRRHCLHCLEPSCQSACLVGAIKRTPEGAVEYDADKCIGCRYCMLACPFSIPRYQYDQPVPYIRKCQMNDDCRVSNGKQACESACPTGATIGGPRATLIEMAKNRIQSNPDRYLNHIYGEHEFGGTSVLYISDIPLNQVLKIPDGKAFEKMQVPNLVNESIPKMLEPWVWVAPVQFFTVSIGLAVTWLFRRRSLLMKKNNQESNLPEKIKKEGNFGNQ